MPPELVPLTEGPSILLDKPILLLGRHQECDIQLNSRKVSRRHCCIAQVENFLVIRDLGSTNGIRINGKKVTEGRLCPGDELTIGNFHFVLRWHGSPENSSFNNSSESLNTEVGREGPASGGSSNISKDVPVPLKADSDQEEFDVELLDLEDQEQVQDRTSSPYEDQPPMILPDNLEIANSSSDIFLPKE